MPSAIREPFPSQDLSWVHVPAALARAPAGSIVTVSIRDLQTAAAYGALEDQVLPAASTIKILILVALARAVDEGRLSLDTVVPVLDSQRVGGSGVLIGLTTPDLALTLADHAWLMITVSDNTASNVLIDAVGFNSIHATQQRFRLRGTSLNRRFLGRLPDPGMPENVATARDLVTVLHGIADGSAASTDLCGWMLSILDDQHYKDQLGRFLPPSVSFAGKSGWLEGICHDCGILTGPNGRAAVAVLTQGITDKYEAASLMGTIGAAAVADLRIA